MVRSVWTAATSKMERFVIIVNGFQPLTIITKLSILDVAAALDPPLVMRLKITISDNDAHSTDVLYSQRCYNKFTQDCKPAESNQEDKGSIEKATAEKNVCNTTKNTSDKLKILSYFLLRNLLIEVNDMCEKYGSEVDEK